jgi:hypothetical protein
LGAQPPACDPEPRHGGSGSGSGSGSGRVWVAETPVAAKNKTPVVESKKGGAKKVDTFGNSFSSDSDDDDLDLNTSCFGNKKRTGEPAAEMIEQPVLEPTPPVVEPTPPAVEPEPTKKTAKAGPPPQICPQ